MAFAAGSAPLNEEQKIETSKTNHVDGGSAEQSMTSPVYASTESGDIVGTQGMTARFLVVQLVRRAGVDAASKR